MDAPEKLCFVNCGLPADQCACYRQYLDATFLPTILATEHARIVAERDAEIARLREVLRKIADADRLPTPSYGGVPGQYDYLPRSGRFGMMARAALGDDDAQREEGTW